MIQTYLEFSFSKMMCRFGILNFGHCYLFVICNFHQLLFLDIKNEEELNPQFAIRNILADG